MTMRKCYFCGADGAAKLVDMLPDLTNVYACDACAERHVYFSLWNTRRERAERPAGKLDRRRVDTRARNGV